MPPEENSIEEIKEIVLDQGKQAKEANEAVVKQHEKIDGQLKEIDKRIETQGTETSEMKTEFQKSVETVERLEEDVTSINEKMQTIVSNAKNGAGADTLKALIDDNKDKLVALAKSGGSLVLGDLDYSLLRKAITSDPASAGPVLDPYRVPGIMLDPNQPLTIRQLLSTVQISTNLVEWVQEKSFTNSAGVQQNEGDPKPESDMDFERKSTGIITLAHWLRYSRQIIADAPALYDIVVGKLRYGLQFVEEQQLLYGAGTGGQLTGIMPQAVAYDAAGLGDPADTRIDQIRKAILQASLALYPADAFVVHPEDWMKMELTKTEDKAYLFANPVNPTQPRLWGKRMVEAMSMTVGDFLAGGFTMGATLYDREQTTVRLSEHHANFFIENMIAVLVEERIGLAVERPAAFVKGTLI